MAQAGTRNIMAAADRTDLPIVECFTVGAPISRYRVDDGNYQGESDNR
jgi:hypothetical protein